MIEASFSQLLFASCLTWSKVPAASRVMRWLRSPEARPENMRPTSSMMPASASLVALASDFSWPKLPS